MSTSTGALGTDMAYYAEKVDIRVVITDTIERLKQMPYHLNPTILKELASLDTHLRGRWEMGEFVWPDVWQPAYPREQYWWLYGSLQWRRK